MNLSTILNQIESIPFAAQFSIINSFRLLQKAFEEDLTLKSLIEDLKSTPLHVAEAFNRLLDLANKVDDLTVQHPHDIALAAYLFAFAKVDFTLAYITAGTLSNYSNLWWAQRLSQLVLETAQTATANIGSNQLSENSPSLQTSSQAISSTKVLNFPEHKTRLDFKTISNDIVLTPAPRAS